MITPRPSFIVGIGGSAGALNAYKALLDALPSNTSMAFVIISHMGPTAHRQLAGILSRHTKMPVLVASRAMPIQRNHVYVIPADADVLIEDYTFNVVSPRTSRNRQIDLLFISIADSVGARGIGIILSGYGGDGTEGCKHIKAQGGSTFAQDRSSEVGGMPRSAQLSGSIDFVLPPHKMPGEILRVARTAKSKRLKRSLREGAEAYGLGTSKPQQNHLLAALPTDVQVRLYPHLELTPLPLGKVLYEPGDIMRHVYFPIDSIVSLLYEMENGDSSEISVVGNEGLIGISLFMGGDSTPSRAVVQNAGCAYRLAVQRFKNEFARHSEMMLLLLRYTQSLITQMTQTAACNRHHSIDQRLCRWLLLSLDRLPSNELAMTQELIANMLGVRREGVTEAASNLQKADVIEYSRGMIRVLDRPKLEELSC